MGATQPPEAKDEGPANRRDDWARRHPCRCCRRLKRLRRQLRVAAASSSAGEHSIGSSPPPSPKGGAETTGDAGPTPFTDFAQYSGEASVAIGDPTTTGSTSDRLRDCVQWRAPAVHLPTSRCFWLVLFATVLFGILYWSDADRLSWTAAVRIGLTAAKRAALYSDRFYRRLGYMVDEFKCDLADWLCVTTTTTANSCSDRCSIGDKLTMRLNYLLE